LPDAKVLYSELHKLLCDGILRRNLGGDRGLPFRGQLIPLPGPDFSNLTMGPKQPILASDAA